MKRVWMCTCSWSAASPEKWVRSPETYAEVWSRTTSWSPSASHPVPSAEVATRDINGVANGNPSAAASPSGTSTVIRTGSGNTSPAGSRV